MHGDRLHVENAMTTQRNFSEHQGEHTAWWPTTRDDAETHGDGHNESVDVKDAEGFPVRSVISETAFIRGADQILLIGVTDITELMWTIQPEPR
jgi:hypothetical protein